MMYANHMGTNTYTEPQDIADLFGVSIGNAEIVRFRGGCEHRRAYLYLYAEMIDGYAELELLPSWEFEGYPSIDRRVKLTICKPVWLPSGANERETYTEAAGATAIIGWRSLEMSDTFKPRSLPDVGCRYCTRRRDI